MKRYKLLSWEEMSTDNRHLAGFDDNRIARIEDRTSWSDDAAYDNYLFFEDDDGDTVRFVASDGGEPEDQTFGRDWGWVVGELNSALITSDAHVVRLANDTPALLRAEELMSEDVGMSLYDQARKRFLHSINRPDRPRGNAWLIDVVVKHRREIESLMNDDSNDTEHLMKLLAEHDNAVGELARRDVLSVPAWLLR